MQFSQGGGPSQEPVARRPWVLKRVHTPAWAWAGLLRSATGDFAYFLNTASLLSILELPRFPETGQPKGTSPFTCDVKIL